ncbi:MAG: 3-oxoacid CoA-transferase subunit B [Deltaproteobacteria bacterium]|nr:3-oxoacid CoA-transferase subunit B [Deltaproteobacteria bacterium]MBI3077352.1 3-oxoacid CoA-transferase subunit B [Deltaproteobacteria bacterium]
MTRPGLPDEQIAQRIAAELEDGWYVNLGVGIPTLVGNCLPPGRDILLHTENGMLGIGPRPPQGEEDIDLINAGNQPVTVLPGSCFFGQADSFAMIRGGHVDVSVLGALQVSERGDLANWMIPGQRVGRVGGAMDIAVGAKRLFVAMGHTTRDGAPKIVKRCTYPLTAVGAVKKIFTNLAVIEVGPAGLVLLEVAPGVTPEQVAAATEPPLTIAPDLRTIPF